MPEGTAQTGNTGTNKSGSQQSTAGNAKSPDAWGSIGVSLDDLPVVGHEQGGTFTPVSGQPSETGKENATPDNTTTPPADETIKPEGQPESGEPPASTPINLKAVNGKEFKTVEELFKTYNESAPEAERLAKELKLRDASENDLFEKLKESHQTILSLQEYVGKGGFSKPYPKPSKPMEEMSEEEKMAYDEEKTTYVIEKKEWAKKQEIFKSQIENAKSESENYAKKVKELIALNEDKMSNDADVFPEFKLLAPLRSQILEKSVWLNNRPETPYLSYLIAYALVTLKANDEAKRKAEESRQAAAQQAGAESQQAGKTGVPATGEGGAKPPEDKELTGITDAYKSKAKPF